MAKYVSINSLRPVRSLDVRCGSSGMVARAEARGSGATLHPAFTIPNSAARPAFSLAELVVAIGVLLFMFSLAGQVFSLTVRSTGQAMALTNVTQMLRAFEDTLREDLRRVEPGRTLLWIQGNPVNAYWTNDGRELDDDAGTVGAGPATGYQHDSDPLREYGPQHKARNGNLVPPRADLLMFFTSGPAESAVDPNIRANEQMVLYGHSTSVNFQRNNGPGDEAYSADPNTVMGASELVVPPLTPFPEGPAGGGLDYISATKVSPIAAEEWTLARRGALLVPTAVPDSPLTGATDVLGGRALLRDPVSGGGLVGEQMFFGLTDVIGNFDFERQVLTPLKGQPFYEPAVLWNNTADFPDATLPDIARRSALDDLPPAPLAATYGQQLLSHCASFKVEWALDSRSAFVGGRLDGVKRMIWIDPGDLLDPSDPASADPLRELRAECLAAPKGTSLRRNLHSLLSDNVNNTNCDPGNRPSVFALRFEGKAADPVDALVTPDGRPNVALFGVRRCLLMDSFGNCDPSGGFEPDPIFPSALRITVDVFDAERRLGDPIRHVMIIPIGG